VGEGEPPGDAELSTEGKLIERLVIILKIDCGGDGKGGEDGEKIDITRLY